MCQICNGGSDGAYVGESLGPAVVHSFVVLTVPDCLTILAVTRMLS